MNSKRIVFLLLAVIVAGTTAFLARAWLQAERAAIAAQIAAPKPVAAPSVQVLVARNALRTGQLIKPEDLRWQAWPQGALPQTYIIEGKKPLTDFVGAVARTAFRVGQPIADTDIVMPGSRGFLAAVLRPGLRAVSVPATATSAVSGFIYAGDRVDVLLTHVLNGDKSGQHTATETILRNARVIAMDQRLDYSPGDKPDVAKTATLELTPKQSEIVTLAVKMGDLSLVLRSLQDTDEKRDPDMADSEMQRIALELKIDPLDVIRRNLIPQRAMPYRTATGALLDSGDFPATLEAAARDGELDDLLARRDAARGQGRHYGIGFAAVVEPSVSNLGYITTALTAEEQS